MAGKNVVIFTTFSDNPAAYSLNRVVQNQLKMLLSHGYSPKIIVGESFKPSGIYNDPKVNLLRIPVVPVHNEVKKDETFDQDVEKLYQSLKDILVEVDIIITHDLSLIHI